MPKTRDIEMFQPDEVSATIDSDDPSVGVVAFYIAKGLLEFQLSRAQLLRLADDLRRALADTAGDLPEG